jgi:hypothetical protein
MLVEGKESGDRGRSSTLRVAEAECRWLMVIVLVEVLLPCRWLLNGCDLLAVRILWKGKYPLYIEAFCQQLFSCDAAVLFSG